MNSDTACSSALSATFSFKKYSTAFTSWFVVLSIALIRAASASEKLSVMLFNAALASALSAGTSAIKSHSASFCNQRTSTCTRYLIRPNSLKIERRATVLLP